MNSLKTAWFCLFLGLFCFSAQAQGEISDSTISFWEINVDYTGGMPGGDLSDRYGFGSFIGGSLGYKTRSNFYFRFGIKALFGNKVREPIGQNILILNGDEKTGYVGSGIGADGRYSDVIFFQRGYAIPLTAGKVFPINGKPNLNSGLYAEVGLQFIQHKVKLEVPSSNVPSMDPNLRYGYDRLSNGLGLVQSFGYVHRSNNRFLNFTVGTWFSQNFTKGRRDIQFDTGLPDDKARLDLMIGFKLGWSFLIYQSTSEKYYFY